MRRTRIILADDHILFRSCLRKVLESKPHLRIMGEAGSCRESLSLVQQSDPDILLLDAQLPSEPRNDVLQQLGSSSDTRAILLTSGLPPTEVARAFHSGARGIVLKNAATDSIFNSIDAVMSGKYWMYSEAVPGLQDALIALFLRSKPPKTGPILNLTQREIDVLRRIAKGYSNKAIGRQLSISEQTVKHHVTNILNKVGASSRLELTLFAIGQRLIGLGEHVPRTT